ncbi:MAG: ester cyclase [Flavisolibacter sp.]|jgi:predicted ester cyclase
MKKLVFAAMFVAVSCCSYGQKSSMSSTAQKNLATARAVAKMFETGDYSKVGDYIATDAVDHAGMQGDVKGLDSIKANFNQMGAMMGNFKNEVIREVADDEYTFQWLKETSTAKTDAMGMKAGQTVTMNAVEVSRFSNGKIAEHWTFVNWSDAMKMMQPGMKQ